LDGCVTVSEAALNEEAEKVLAGKGPDDLIMSLRGCVSMLVGRYLANWPTTSRFVDEMASEGIAEIVRLCHNIPVDKFRERGILKLATSRAQTGIEDMLNSIRSISSPSNWTQKKLLRTGKDPIYLTTEATEYNEESHPMDNGDEQVRDIIDAFCKLVPEDRVDAYIMDEYNWGRTNEELAAEIGVGKSTIHRRRQRLYQRYLEITE
jgi:hypothetical protein